MRSILFVMASPLRKNLLPSVKILVTDSALSFVQWMESLRYALLLLNVSLDTVV